LVIASPAERVMALQPVRPAQGPEPAAEWIASPHGRAQKIPSRARGKFFAVDFSSVGAAPLKNFPVKKIFGRIAARARKALLRVRNTAAARFLRASRQTRNAVFIVHTKSDGKFAESAGIPVDRAAGDSH
jgi:hypothetical protein